METKGEPQRATEDAELVPSAPEFVLATCGHTTHVSRLRRGLCDACYRKLRDEGCPLPPRGSRWDDYDGLAAWARALPDDARRRLLAALMEVR